MMPIKPGSATSNAQPIIMNSVIAMACFAAASNWSGANHSAVGTMVMRTQPAGFRQPSDCSSRDGVIVAATALATRLERLYPDEPHRNDRRGRTGLEPVSDQLNSSALEVKAPRGDSPPDRDQ